MSVHAVPETAVARGPVARRSIYRVVLRTAQKTPGELVWHGV